MTVTSLHRSLATELRDLLSAMYGNSFSDRLIDRIVRRLVSPKRLSLCKRLACLVSALSRCGLDPIEFMYMDTLSSHAMTSRLIPAVKAGRGFSILNGCLQMQMSDASRFDIPLSHLSELVCTAHAIAEWLGPDELHRLIDEVAGDPNSPDAIHRAAAETARKFDQYRQRRLGSSSVQMKRRALMAFLSERHPGQSYNAADITSDTAKAFWMSHGDRADLDVKTYSGIHRLFETFIEVLDEHLDVELTGDFDAAGVEAGSSGQEDWIALREESGRLKFMFPAQIERGRPFTDAPACAWRLRPSAAWSGCYSPVQTKLSEGMDMQTYHEAWSFETNWDEALQTVTRLHTKMREVALAVLHMLITRRKSGALALAYGVEGNEIIGEALDGLNLSQLSEDDVLDLQQEQLDRLCDADEPVYAALRQRAETAWKNIRRDGFHAADLDDDRFMNDIDRLSSRLVGALAFLERLQSAWDAQHPDQASMQKTRGEFDLTFQKIYLPERVSRVSS